MSQRRPSLGRLSLRKSSQCKIPKTLSQRKALSEKKSTFFKIVIYSKTQQEKLYYDRGLICKTHWRVFGRNIALKPGPLLKSEWPYTSIGGFGGGGPS